MGSLFILFFPDLPRYTHTTTIEISDRDARLARGGGERGGRPPCRTAHVRCGALPCSDFRSAGARTIPIVRLRGSNGVKTQIKKSQSQTRVRKPLN